MEDLNNLMHGFSVALTLPNLAFMLLGIVLGVTGIGWLQGITGRYGLSFLVLGGGLALFAAAFAVTGRRASAG